MQLQKRQDLPKGLWMVATPIGNLADLSTRAIWAFQDADGIFSEDTRRTRELLSALGITGKRLERMDAEIESQSKGLSRAVELVAESQKGWVFVSDAGTPGIADPGAKLVQAVREAG